MFGKGARKIKFKMFVIPENEKSIIVFVSP
jgi:hypothetical protein